MLTSELVPCFVQSFSIDSKTGYEKALQHDAAVAYGLEVLYED